MKPKLKLLGEDGRYCNNCNATVVITARIKEMPKQG